MVFGRKVVVGGAVEEVEASGTAGWVLLDFVGLDEDTELEKFFAKVAFVE